MDTKAGSAVLLETVETSPDPHAGWCGNPGWSLGISRGDPIDRLSRVDGFNALDRLHLILNCLIQVPVLL